MTTKEEIAAFQKKKLVESVGVVSMNYVFYVCLPCLCSVQSVVIDDILRYGPQRVERKQEYL